MNSAYYTCHFFVHERYQLGNFGQHPCVAILSSVYLLASSGCGGSFILKIQTALFAYNSFDMIKKQEVKIYE